MTDAYFKIIIMPHTITYIKYPSVKCLLNYLLSRKFAGGRFAEDALRIHRKMPRHLAKRIQENVFL